MHSEGKKRKAKSALSVIASKEIRVIMLMYKRLQMPRIFHKTLCLCHHKHVLSCSGPEPKLNNDPVYHDCSKRIHHDISYSYTGVQKLYNNCHHGLKTHARHQTGAYINSFKHRKELLY